MWQMGIVVQRHQIRQTVNYTLRVVCDEYSRIISCRTTVATPINFGIRTKIGSTEVNYEIQCAWEATLSEIRIVFVFLAIALTYLGYIAIDQEDTWKSSVVLYGMLIVGGLFFISAFSDVSEVIGAGNNNKNLCELRGKYKVGEGVDVISYQCSYFRFYIMAALSMICGCALISGSYFIKNWQKSIAKKDSN